MKYKHVFCSLYIVAFRMYRYSVFAATFVGEGPPLEGTFITREDSELTVYQCVVCLVHYNGLWCNGTMKMSL